MSEKVPDEPATSPGAPRLTIVGLGPARAEHVTTEAVSLLQAAAARGARAYGLSHVREVVAQVAPALDVRSLDTWYALPGVDRPTLYRDLATMLMRRAFDEGHEVLYLVAGSPLYVNDAVTMLRHGCATAGHPVKLVHGVSFVDLVLDRVYWTGHGGLQLYSAWNVARDGVELSTGVPALLFQLGEFSRGSDALDPAGSPVMLAELRDRLVGWYPVDHPVIVLFSSGPPHYRSLAARIPLSALAEQPVPVYSNLWVPSLDGPDMEREVAPPSDGLEPGVTQ